MRNIKALLPWIALAPYLLYAAYIILGGRGPVDFETFMSIGARLASGLNPYGPNSYYPLPFVFLFAALSLLPKPIAMALWFFGPLAVILMASNWRPWVLLFAPVFAHFVGGQADIFAVLGLWGFNTNSRGLSGAWLALTLLKPQLAVVPVTFAMVGWVLSIRSTRTFPKPLIQFLLTTAILFIPSFFLRPDWPIQWLKYPRPFFERAMSAVLPRTLLASGVPPSTAYWVTLILGGSLLLILIWRLARRRLTLALSVMWGFLVHPLVHDYDLVQMVPILATPRARLAAILSSLPGWLVILFMYGNDRAWYAFSFIAPVVIAVMLKEIRSLLQAPQVPARLLAA
jgi:hypothetical protein